MYSEIGVAGREPNYYLYLFSLPAITVVRNILVARIVKNSYPEIKCRGSLSTEQKRDLNRKIYGLFI